MSGADDYQQLLRALTPQERAEFDQLLLNDHKRWRPLPGPQTMAQQSEADIVGFGGAAGGGKTDLVIGLALTEHRKAAIFRQNGTELVGINDRVAELFGGSRANYNGKDHIWEFTREDGVRSTLELGAFPNTGDETKYQGRPHDFLGFDEASNMRPQAVRFLLGWLRSNVVGQRKRALLSFNPPTSVEGRWVIEFFAPWLDRKHPRPAKPGELRWFATVAGRDMEVADARPFIVVEDQPVYEFDPKAHPPASIVRPMSRTFIPSRVADNPYYMATNYVSVLQALPEPLRSQMLHGDFAAGVQDDPFQVIPTSWVEAAMARWVSRDIKPPMDSLGADIALGGRDDTVLIRRHGNWFDTPLVYPGKDCVNGAVTAGFIVSALRDQAVTHLDLFGVGAQPYGALMALGLQVVGVNVGEPAPGLDRSGKLSFFNLRSQLWWRMREALDPLSNQGLALPPHPRLLADLCAPTWEATGQKIKVASREDIVKALGRSPDYGSACVLALCDTPKRALIYGVRGEKPRDRGGRDYDPIERMMREQHKR